MRLVFTEPTERDLDGIIDTLPGLRFKTKKRWRFVAIPSNGIGQRFNSSRVQNFLVNQILQDSNFITKSH